ncbi:uncharacterized protein LOC133801080 [Humulus lupulus]|uniref:uncharacterized protein LOC133801080 n=1 Tax=Humulus lupulus TaxID=3486 RepID=UPI002B4098D3|nr:uncharacterized protein LOC133801080 [Humulus lupulus]
MSSNSLRKRIAFRRELRILRALNTAKSHAKRKSVVMDALSYIYLMKLKVEAIQKEYSNLVAIKENKKIMNQKEVKVEKTEEGFMNVRVRCEKGEDTLVSVLEAFENIGLQVLQARVSCTNGLFYMEATTISTNVVSDQNRAHLDARNVTRVISNAIEKK